MTHSSSPRRISPSDMKSIERALERIAGLMSWGGFTAVLGLVIVVVAAFHSSIAGVIAGGIILFAGGALFCFALLVGFISVLIAALLVDELPTGDN